MLNRSEMYALADRLFESSDIHFDIPGQGAGRGIHAAKFTSASMPRFIAEALLQHLNRDMSADLPEATRLDLREPGPYGFIMAALAIPESLAQNPRFQERLQSSIPGAAWTIDESQAHRSKEQTGKIWQTYLRETQKHAHDTALSTRAGELTGGTPYLF